MDEISIPYTIGNEIKQLTLRFMLDGNPQIIMDKRYHGQCVFAQGQWRVYLADKSELNNSEDIQALIQILNVQQE